MTRPPRVPPRPTSTFGEETFHRLLARKTRCETKSLPVETRSRRRYAGKVMHAVQHSLGLIRLPLVSRAGGGCELPGRLLRGVPAVRVRPVAHAGSCVLPGGDAHRLQVAQSTTHVGNRVKYLHVCPLAGFRHMSCTLMPSPCHVPQLLPRLDLDQEQGVLRPPARHPRLLLPQAGAARLSRMSSSSGGSA